jgi:hypothetical protein
MVIWKISSIFIEKYVNLFARIKGRNEEQN